MTKEILFESLEHIDDELLEKSGKRPIRWQKFATAAACLCLLLIAAVTIPKINSYLTFDDENKPPINIEQPPEPNQQLEGPNLTDLPQIPTDPDPVEPDVPTVPGVPVEPHEPEAPTLPEFLFDAVYNETDGAFSASRQYISGYFQEKLYESEIELLKPTDAQDWMAFSGFAGYDGEGKLLEIRISTPTTVPETNITVAISKVWPVKDYIFSGEEVISRIGDTEIVMYRWEKSKTKVFLEADAVIDGANISFTVTTEKENEEAAKKDLETVVYLYAHWFNAEKLDEITAENIPEWRDDKLSLAQAYEDETFGKYLPQNIPEGFTAESIRRYIDYQNNRLSGLWTKGMAQISWVISYLEDEDEARFTDIESVENYDLSLYPIPMAQSVPDELREIVDHPIFEISELTLDAVYARSRLQSEDGDISGYKTSFDVRFGDVVIRITTKGIDPQWIFDELQKIK